MSNFPTWRNAFSIWLNISDEEEHLTDFLSLRYRRISGYCSLYPVLMINVFTHTHTTIIFCS